MNRRFAIEWPDFAVKVAVELLDSENPALCEAFWKRLPFRTIFAASMSAGEMFKVPIPFILPLAPPEKAVFFPDLPPGSIVGHSWGGVLVKYGICAEPFRLPLLARVLPEDMHSLQDAAARLRDAYFFTKEINIATLSRAAA